MHDAKEKWWSFVSRGFRNIALKRVVGNEGYAYVINWNAKLVCS
tara:strand:- start:309 stop:440 length:132 start_codon:yes stop_codon:yes gene_type:complete